MQTRLETHRAHHSFSTDKRMPPRFWYQSHCHPEFSCIHESRVGTNKDGGKWVCNIDRVRYLADLRVKNGGKCIVYSIGSDDDFSFEVAVHEELPNCEIHTFGPIDYSAAVPEGKNIHFHNWELKQDNAQREEKFKSVQQTLKTLGHQGMIIDLFKLDCEGCEWSIYDDLLLHSNVDIRQFLVETHGVPKNATSFFTSIQKAGYVMFHKDSTPTGLGNHAEFSFLKLKPEFFARLQRSL